MPPVTGSSPTDKNPPQATNWSWSMKCATAIAVAAPVMMYVMGYLQKISDNCKDSIYGNQTTFFENNGAVMQKENNYYDPIISLVRFGCGAFR